MSSLKLFVNLIVLTLSLSVGSYGKTDTTLVDRAKGKDVVEAVDYLIRNSTIFADSHNFVVRMAYVATQFGEDNDTFTTKLNIWALGQAQFELTKNIKTNPALNSFLIKINQIFGIDWTKVQYTELSKPLIAGLAVNLILTLNQPVPAYLEEQGKYYNKIFGIFVQDFETKVRNMEKLSKCYGRMDLAIVVDGSGSIGATNFQLARQFVSSLVDTFSPTNVNLAIIIYGTVSTVVVPFDSNLSKVDLKAKILSANYPSSNTNTSGAILTARDMLIKATHKEGSPRIMAIFTDGAPNDPAATVAAATQAVKSNITLFAIGIGASIQQGNLLAMALNNPNHVFSMSSYKTLSESFEMMNTETCKVSQKPNIGTKIDDSLTQNEKRFFCYDLPQIGITVTIDVKVGKTDAFYSYSLTNPSSALNDGSISGKTYIPVLTSTRVCVTVKGLEINNNFTINSEEGNKVVAPTTTAPPDDGDDLLNIRRKAHTIAKEALNTMKNYNQMSNEICNQMSKMYAKYEWICIVGEKVEISEHQLPSSLFQFGIKEGNTDFFFIINVPDN